MKNVFRIIGSWQLLTLITGALLITACPTDGKLMAVLPADNTRQELANALADAKGLFAGIVRSANGEDVQTYEWYLTPVIFDEVKNSIDEAERILDSPTAKPEQRTQAISELEAVIELIVANRNKGKSTVIKRALFLKIIEAIDEMNKVMVSDVDGDDVMANKYWVPVEIYNDLEDALGNAIAVRDDRTAGQVSVDNALQALNDAFEAFIDAKVLGKSVADKTLLNAKIHEAEQALDDVQISDAADKVPSESKWVTQAVYNTFTAAISTAKSVNNNKDAPQTEVNAALATLTAALTTFINAQAYGSAAVPLYKSAEAILWVNDERLAYHVELIFDSNVQVGPGGDAQAGFAIQNGRRQYIITGAVITGNKITFTLDNATPINNKHVPTISYSKNLGHITNSADIPLGDFAHKPVTNNTLPANTLPSPWLVRAAVEDNARSIVKVEFNEPIGSVDISKFHVLVNSMPVGTANPFLTSGAEFREIISASGSGKNWNLTMEAPALYGEILRLEAVHAGAAATELYEVDLPKIPQLIIRSMVKRTKEGFENAGGFYIDGVKQSTAVNSTLLKSAITAINGASDKLGKTWTVVLDQDQTGFNPGGTFSSGTFTGSTLVITSNSDTPRTVNWANNGGVFTSRNGLTIVVDKNIIFQGTTNNHHLMMAMDAGKIILDGAELRGNSNTQTSDNAGALRIGGGANGAIILMNDGKIIGNSTTNNRTATGAIAAYAGAVTISDYGAFIMHNGEISGNKAAGDDTVTPRAGAIATGVHRGSGRYQNVAVYITGGVIKDNEAEGGDIAVTGAGGILCGGVFQKTGGTIEANKITGFAGDVRSGQIAVITSGWSGNPTAAQAAIRGTAAGPNVLLFIDSTGSNTYGKAAWLPDSWD